jgi:hypothetical protein
MRFAVPALFAFCAALAARLAIAGYRFDLDSAVAVERAADAVESGEYAERLAEIDPDRAQGALEKAIRWNPRSSAARIALGLEEERARDFDGAARELLRAAEIDHQYLPAWTLANFYFRRGDREAFKIWARRAAELVPGDVEPLMELCDRIDDGNGLAVLPQEPKFERAYLDLLIREKRLNDAGRVARRLALRRDGEDVRRLSAFITRLIDAGLDAEAIALWRQLVPGEGLVNGDLRTAPSGEGLDWRMRPVEGIASNWRPGMLSFQLWGREPESCVLLEQPAPVEPAHYRLRFEYQAVAGGVRWMLDGEESPALTANNGWFAAERGFSATRSGLAWLRLIYKRETGSVKAEGTIQIRSLRWDKN